MRERKERAGGAGRAIAHGGRAAILDAASDESGLHQRGEGERERAIREARNEAGNLGEAGGTRRHRGEDRQGPSAEDDIGETSSREPGLEARAGLPERVR